MNESISIAELTNFLKEYDKEIGVIAEKNAEYLGKPNKQKALNNIVIGKKYHGKQLMKIVKKIYNKFSLKLDQMVMGLIQLEEHFDISFEHNEMNIITAATFNKAL